MPQSMFERYGGFAVVRKIVSEFYDRILDAPNLQGYFANVEMRLLIDHQTKFIAQMMGGPASYTNDTLQRVHAHLGIGHADFLEMADILRETLEDFDLQQADIDLVYREVMRREPYIVARR
ncbi:MAG TPA: group 1 truncated hemoglobin [Azospirillaceae bacterium]|nr:group 1 truncated hemoglobin [Azospirillaceae bacterium]